MKDDPFVIVVSWRGGVTCTENRQFDTDKIKSKSFRTAALWHPHLFAVFVELFGRFLLSLCWKKGLGVADETERKLETHLRYLMSHDSLLSEVGAYGHRLLRYSNGPQI